MLLLQIFFVCITAHIGFCAEIAVSENIREQTLNSSQSSESNHNIEASLDTIFGTTQSTEHHQTVVDPDCKCIPYYLCNDTIVDDGLGTIDFRGGSSKDESCENYLDVCCKEVPNSTDKPVTMKPFIRRSECGQRNIEGLGFNPKENESKLGEFPWVVAILQEDQDKPSLDGYQCEGSLIHTQVVLTAAHCVVGKDPKKLKARAGEWDFGTPSELFPHQDRNVKEIIVHENYSAAEFHNNIALLIVETPFNITENVDLICLPDEGEIMDGRQCVTSGWEKSDFGHKSLIMKKAEFPTVPRERCSEALRKTILGQSFKLHESFICAGDKPGQRIFASAGGSPLACPSQNNSQIYRQAGIAAWEIDFGNTTPAIYVNVSYLRGWITSKISSYT